MTRWEIDRCKHFAVYVILQTLTATSIGLFWKSWPIGATVACAAFMIGYLVEYISYVVRTERRYPPKPAMAG